MLAEIAARAGDPRAAVDLFERAVAEYVGAGLPWFAVEYEARLAGLVLHLGAPERAERALRAALEHGGAHLEAAGQAQLRLQLAEVLGGLDRVEEAVRHSLEAAHWADEADGGPALGAWARLQLGGLLLRLGRWAEAAEVLESALLELSAETHGDGAVVQARWWLGDCLSELGEHRAAAEHRLRAAEIARHWPEQQDHATLAHLAAESLSRAELHEEADRAYARAGDLWRSLDDVHGLVRATRARAWLALRTEAGPDAARELMRAAVAECEKARDSADDEGTRQRFVAELGHTHRQFGDLLAGVAAEAEDGSTRAGFEEALARMEQAVAAFALLGPDALYERTGAELAAGWLAADLGRPAEAEERARGVLAACQDGQDGRDDQDGREGRGTDIEEDLPRIRCAEARQLLDALRKPSED